MSMKSIVYDRITTNDKLHNLGYVAEEVYRSVGMENTQSNKFIVLRWGSETAWMGSHSPTTLTVWVYDVGRSYSDIDEAVDVIRDEILLPLLDVRLGDSPGVTQVEWNGHSEDLYDDVMKRITRNSVYTINHHNG